MRGTYIVGVYGSAKCNYQISFTSGGSLDYFKVFQNTPYDYDLNANGAVYLEYLHFSEDSI